MMKRLFLTLVLLLLAACQTQQGARVGEASSGGGSAFSGQGIDGTWQGVVIHGSQILHIQLNLAPAADLPPQVKLLLSSQTSTAQTAQMYEGAAYAQDFSGYLAKHDITKDIASENMPVYGVFDPQLRTFRLFPKPQARARMGRLGLEFHLHNLGGVHDQREDVLAGLKPSQVGATQAPNSGDQHFFFARSSRFKDEAKSFDPSVSWVPSLGPSRSDLTQWLQPFFSEYPGANLYQSVHGRLELAAIKLFRDDHFKKYFGDPFDELSSTQLKNIQRAMQNPGGRDATDQSIVALNRMFWVGRGDNAAAQTALWVKAQRHMLHWRQDQLTALPRLPGLKNSLEHIDQVEQELAKVAPALLWPSELKGDKAQLLQSRQAIAYPALRTMLAEFDAATPSLNLMHKVASWQADERRLFGYLPSDQAHALRASANQRLTAIISALLPSYRQRMAASGAGLPAVLAGVNWHRDFTRDFALVANHPLVQETLNTFAAQRAQHLNQAQAEMLAKIREATPNCPPIFLRRRTPSACVIAPRSNSLTLPGLRCPVMARNKQWNQCDKPWRNMVVWLLACCNLAWLSQPASQLWPTVAKTCISICIGQKYLASLLIWVRWPMTMSPPNKRYPNPFATRVPLWGAMSFGPCSMAASTNWTASTTKAAAWAPTSSVKLATSTPVFTTPW
jgi:hypothetical protein